MNMRGALHTLQDAQWHNTLLAPHLSDDTRSSLQRQGTAGITIVQVVHQLCTQFANKASILSNAKTAHCGVECWWPRTYLAISSCSWHMHLVLPRQSTGWPATQLHGQDQLPHRAAALGVA